MRMIFSFCVCVCVIALASCLSAKQSDTMNTHETKEHTSGLDSSASASVTLVEVVKDDDSSTDIPTKPNKYKFLERTSIIDVVDNAYQWLFDTYGVERYELKNQLKTFGVDDTYKKLVELTGEENNHALNALIVIFSCDEEVFSEFNKMPRFDVDQKKK